MEPAATPMLLEMLKWGLAGFKGSQEVEGVLDQAIEKLNQQQSMQKDEQKEPSPEQIKAQMEQAKQQFEMQKMQMQTQADQQKQQGEMQQIQLEAQIRQQEIQAEAQSKLEVERAQAVFNIDEEAHETEQSNKRELFKHELALELLNANTAAQRLVSGDSND